MDNQSKKNKTNVSNTGARAKFIIFSLLGAVLFFGNFIPSGEHRITPLVWIINGVRGALGTNLLTITFILMMGLTISSIASFFIDDNKFLNFFHGKDSKVSRFLYMIGGLFAITFMFKLGPAWWLNPKVGLSAWNISGSVMITVGLAGGLITLITEFGMLEFIGTIMEPVMRPVYNLPGHAAVDAVASFVSASSVGIMITDNLYQDKHYTKREAANVAASFSVASLGLFLFLVDAAGTPHLYTKLILSSFIIVFIMAAIMDKLPPISKLPNEYIDGTPREELKKVKFKGSFRRAMNSATEKAVTASSTSIIKSTLRSLLFAIKIAAIVAAIAPIAMALSEYTPIFEWMGIPFVPYLRLVGMSEAAKIAPSMVVGITQIALPLYVILPKAASVASVFFVMLLSTVQIIFFNESANAIIESEIPLGFVDCVAIFFIRTIIAIPLCAIATHILF